ncbi:MAG: hypothetical protein IH609_11915 [Dehalococcoidia bacterium]|nr:hypothetical protein [Dehalococcoidia bacterium]
MSHLRAALALFDPATLFALAGAAMLVAGLAMIYLPLAFLLPGAALIALGLWLALPKTG